MTRALLLATVIGFGPLPAVAQDSWANWKDTWVQMTEHYGIAHFDTDMSSAQELVLFENEGENATADIGDVGLDFGPIAVSRDLLQPYKTTTWDQIPAWTKDADGMWAMPHTGTIAFIVSADLENPQTSWKDLVAGDYTFSIAGAGSAAQSNAAILAAAIANGGGETDLARNGRLRANEANPTSMQRGEVEVAALWDFNALNYAATVGGDRYTVVIPSDGSVTSGYASIINKHAPNPNAAMLARECIFSDKGRSTWPTAMPARSASPTSNCPKQPRPASCRPSNTRTPSPIDAAAWQETVLSEMLGDGPYTMSEPLKRVILIVLDGLRYDTARDTLGWLEGQVNAGRAECHRITCELPAMSRPLYETILTGRVPADHGIVSNHIARRSTVDSLFARVRAAGGSTAAAAYHWVSEPYVRTPFDPQDDRLQEGGEAISRGSFYWNDAYPDDHLFADAQMLLRQDPHFMLLHPMNVDDAGHKAGGNSTP